MSPERWARIDAVLDGALDLPTGERAAYLDAACAGDDVLRAEVARLLAASEAPDGALPDQPAAVFAATLVARTLGAGVDDAAGAVVRHPERVGPWRVVRPAGAGGMGTVYVVERADGAFRMTAALKLVRRGLHLDEHFLRRFRDERQILARLVHPSVARLLDGGVTDDGLPYYVMEYVDGAPIDRWCDARALSVEARLALFAKVCDAVAYAHQHRVVHRDLKPSNILVTPEGEPKLLDFGIAKLLAPDGDGAPHASAERPVPTALTRTGQRLLTPEYASPEQIRGEAVTATSDVYALGVILYELLTGRRPYGRGGRTAHELERAVLDDEPTRPSALVARAERPASRATSAAAVAPATVAGEAARARDATPAQLRRRLRGDLDAVALTALRKEPARRYPSAVALAADVRRHLEGRAVLARGDGPAYRLRKWAHRHRATAAAVAVGMATGIGVIAASVGSDAPGDAPGDVPGLAAVVSTPSSAAARAYRDGLRAFARGNWGEATRQFQSALAEDSTFALAALYASESAERDGDYALSRRALDRAVRLAGAAPERDRLVVRAYQAHRLRLPAVAAYADSLVRRWPDAVEGPVYAARAAFMAGDFARSRAMWRRAASMDSLSLVRGLAPCFACEARQQLVNVHIHMDSLDAAEREARVLLALLPDAASSWRYLAMVHALRGDEDETAYRRAVELDPGNADYAAEWLADRRIRRGDFASAEEVLRGRMATAPADREERSLGLLITALRNQARWTEALALARRFRTLAPDGPPAPDAPAGAAPSAALHEAQVLFESGHPREAAALFDSVGLWTPDVRGFTPGHRIWHLAHAADALAAAGDTARLGAIADTIGALAPRSGYARDARLEHHVRGLLHAARGDDDAAVAAFRRAVYSPNMGYTRTNHELARALLRLGRPREAVAALQPALRGSLEVNNTHITHAELHAALAAAWDAAGDADSAAAHRAWVAGARRHGEPRLARTDAPTGARLVPGAARRVAFDAGLELDPALAPDGARVAYASEAGGAMRLHVRPTAGGPGVALATTVPGDHRAPRWSPDGRTLAFQADGRIYAVPSAGGAARVLVAPEAGARWVAHVAWSPDGRQLAYVQDWAIHVRPVSGGAARRLAVTAPVPLAEPHALAWSPDGRWIAFVDNNAEFTFGLRPWGSTINLGNSAPSAIWRVPAQGGEVVRLTDGRTLNTSPVWLPDGRGLVFVSNRDGSRDVYQLALDESGHPAAPAVRVTAGLDVHSASLARDGRRLGYSVFRSAANVWSLPVPRAGVLTDASAEPVTSGSQTVEGLSVSADGQWLAFDTDRNGNQDVYLVRTRGGGEPRALSTDPSDEFMPHWSPDGRELAYYRFGSDGRRRMLTVPAAGGASRPVVDAPRDQRSPHWSPNGRALVFSSDATGRHELYVTARARGGAWQPARRLTTGGGYAGRWSPDGRTIAFARPDGIWTVAAGGGAPRPVLRIDRAQEASLGYVEWSADGRTLFFKWIDDQGLASFRAVPAAGGPPRVLVQLHDPRRRSPRPEFATDGRRFYFTIAERESDVWTMELDARP